MQFSDLNIYFLGHIDFCMYSFKKYKVIRVWQRFFLGVATRSVYLKFFIFFKFGGGGEVALLERENRFISVMCKVSFIVIFF